MKNLLLLFVMSIGCLSATKAQIKLPKNLGGSKTITIDHIPSTTDEFIQMRDRMPKTPEGGAAILVLATVKYSLVPVMCRHRVITATDPSWLASSSAGSAYKGFDLGDSANFSLQQTDRKKYIPDL